jgi:hypothetical protein
VGSDFFQTIAEGVRQFYRRELFGAQSRGDLCDGAEENVVGETELRHRLGLEMARGLNGHRQFNFGDLL